MSSFDWERFLQQWSQEIMASIGSDRDKLPLEVIESNWFGYPGATEAEIAQAEIRLGRALPPSYRAFLKVTNGWRQTTPFISRLWSTQEIDWFAVRHQDWLDAILEKLGYLPANAVDIHPQPDSVSDQEYFVYGEQQDCSKIRAEYLQTALEISQQGEAAIYLLNPQVVTETGEWEAWFLGDWLPGADRYHSFQDMMQAEYENFLELRDAPAIPSSNVAPHLKRSNHLFTADASTRSAADASSDISETTSASVTKANIESNLDNDQSNKSEKAFEPNDRRKDAKINSNLNEIKLENLSLENNYLENNITNLELDEWTKIASFTVAVQSRQNRRYTQQRTIVQHLESGTTTIYPNINPEIAQQWIADQLKASTAQLEKAMGLEITQLRIIRPSPFETDMIVEPTNPLFCAPIEIDDPFALEASVQVVGSADNLVEQQLVYRAQCFAYNLSTHTKFCIGDVVTSTTADQLTCTAHFSEITLHQPGLYRLTVWIILQNISASPGRFKVPILQVV